MRILHVLNHTQRLNGHVHAAVDLACAQVGQGHDVCVASGGGDFDGLLKRKGVHTVLVDHKRSFPNLAKALVHLRSHVRSFRADVVHAHMMTSAVLAFPVCRMSGIPLITTVHNEFEKSATLMGLGTRVIAVSDVVGASMQRRGVPSSRLCVVLNGTIGSARSDGRSEEPAPLVSPSILFVGGLHPRKGLPDLMEALEIVHRSNPNVHLYIVGDGPHRDAYKNMASQLACAKAITFVGPTTDPYPYMLGADIFVLPSHADPAPLVLSEAREAHCAVIGTQVDGIPQLLEHGDAGILVPPHDPSALAEALIQIVETPGKIEEWKARSQLRIDHLTIDRVARETMQVYVSALASRSTADAGKVKHSNLA
ncbi:MULTISPECIES: glycosyltransferase family 4 protein [unclassified Rhizobium]|uniref:glycosyltransferase family 4 protein n=1 Tax=unclassified Rhizobium TaxID=2613769 RepID=UPI001617E87B|nr:MULTISPECIES: glycosyltransferase family 4 protein [unclassified Rhizobium]MBB3543897.1 glycosyltransferase involved in cell wall biosynthesis [Rhizobium sp. BK399]MCS3742193.1 glycosyltransferase involved in cell wall biosynthesis [Rhizobium sp. BK661]MCS4094120.1 glycosyltransferase involved in cell wall biosynthesis [Rhizobium sp. BK176]